MSWQARIDRVIETEAETQVDVSYFDQDSEVAVHTERLSFPAGTPRPQIRKEIARTGREARAALRPAHPLEGELINVDET